MDKNTSNRSKTSISLTDEEKIKLNKISSIELGKECISDLVRFWLAQYEKEYKL